MKNEKDSNGPGESEFDFLGFGSLFKGIEKLVDLASKLEQTGAINREGEMNLDHLKKGMKGVYGFTIKSAVGGGICLFSAPPKRRHGLTEQLCHKLWSPSDQGA